MWRELRVAGQAPSLPAGIRIYTLSDIHGRLDLLEDLLAKIRTDRTLRPAIRCVYLFLGDYIDRGPSSRQTIDRLITLADESECIFLRGNHESVALRCLRDSHIFDDWMRFGGSETLCSYGVNNKTMTSVAEMQAAFHEAIPTAHLRFFRDLQDTFVCGDFFFVHAGVKPGVALPQQKQDDLLWIRDEFLSWQEDFGKIVVHGHTPVSEVDFRPNRINIDTGAYASNCLSCLILENGLAKVIDTRD